MKLCALHGDNRIGIFSKITPPAWRCENKHFGFLIYLSLYRRKEAKEGGQEARAHPNGLMPLCREEGQRMDSCRDLTLLFVYSVVCQ